MSDQKNKDGWADFFGIVGALVGLGLYNDYPTEYPLVFALAGALVGYYGFKFLVYALKLTWRLLILAVGILLIFNRYANLFEMVQSAVGN
jgi:hypothetical protein